MPTALPRLALFCFGPPTALVDDEAPPPPVLWPRHLALLIYLALSPQLRRSRAHLASCFWGERADARARGNLSEAIHRLRGALGRDRLNSQGDTLALNSVGLELDAIRFEIAARRSPEEAAHLVRGDFLEGFHVDDAPEFDMWVTRERDRYRALFAASLIAVGEQQLGRGHFVEAADAGRRALGLLAHSEGAARLVIRTAAISGDIAGALAMFHEFAARLKKDRGEEPSGALAALADRVRRGRWNRPGLPASTNEPEPPLTGRGRAYSDAFEIVRKGVAGGPRSLIITGAPGMGRTRLLNECSARADLDAALVIFARPLESDQDASWSTLRQLLRGGLTSAPGLAGANPDALAVLANVARELTPRFAPRDVRDVADMAASLAAALATVGEDRAILIAVDDAHWADGSSLAALHGAVASLQKVPIVLVLTVATGVGAPPRELLALQGAVGRPPLPGVTVRLDPLGDEDVRALVTAEARWCTRAEDLDRLSRRVAFESGGSPLFAVALLRALAQATTLRSELATWPPAEGPTDAPLPFSVPSLLRYALAARLTDLSPDETRILRAASVCGQELDLDVVAWVAECSRNDLESALPAFERRQLVTFDGRRYAFVAPLMVEVIRSELLTKGERRGMERRAFEAFAGRTDLEGRIRRVELYASVEPGAGAFQEALAAARDAVKAGARRVARRALAAAERTGVATDRAELDQIQAWAADRRIE